MTAIMGFWEVRSNLISIQNLSHFESTVNVIREGESKQVLSTDLVVGDIVEISPFSTAPCGIPYFFFLFFIVTIYYIYLGFI